MTLTSHSLTRAMLLAFSLNSTGCSLIFVKPPRNDGSITRRAQAASCTRSNLAPALDTTFATLQLIRTGLAASASDSVYENPKQPLSREADVALGVAFTTLFVSSAIYGFVNTSECRRLRAPEDDGVDASREDEAITPTGSPRRSPGPVVAPAEPPVTADEAGSEPEVPAVAP